MNSRTPTSNLLEQTTLIADTSQTQITTELPSTISSPTTVVTPTTKTFLTTTKQSSVTRPCVNGHDDGTKCVCKRNFYGTLCEFILDEIRPTVEASLDVVVTVKNVNFSKELQDFESKEYKLFEERFKEQMYLVYSKMPHYQGVKILNITQGSVVVDHMVFVQVPPEEYDNVVSDMTTILVDTDCTSSSMNNETLCFGVNQTKVEKVDLNLADACLNAEDIPLEVRKFYFPKNVSGVITCVSDCSTYSDNRRDCHKGQCSVTLEGPHCYCETSNQFWYSGANCQNAISKPGVYAGVTVSVAVLFIIIVALSVVSYRRRKKSNNDNLIGKEKQWYEDGWEEDNHAYGQLHSSSSSNEGSLGSNFQPHLERVNPNVTMRFPRPFVMPDALKWESRS
ncbi:mucin-17-like [Pyxicephalus adspersus]|uniref:mucin-17-like n=1 Tax=Pyxicephalus adspersus TaxID=30357 RepID=UPI003B5CEB32